MLIGQISNLAHHLSREEWIQVQFENPKENMYSALSKATDPQFKYIQFLRTQPSGKLKIRDILINLGLKPNI